MECLSGSAVDRSRIHDNTCGEADRLAALVFHEKTRRTASDQATQFLEPDRHAPDPAAKSRPHASHCPSAGDDEEDRTLLVLRVDRALEWEEVARVTLGVAEPDATLLKRETERLRKRFQLLKDELKGRAKELLDE